MAEIKETFSKEPDRNLASFDFYDLATGTGYKAFYMGDLKSGSDATSYSLSTQVFYSNKGVTNVNPPNKDFDIVFQVPTTIEGDATFNIWMASPDNINPTAYLDLYRVVNGVETHIGTQVSSGDMAVNADTTPFSGVYNIPKTTFKRGEVLRVTLNDSGANSYWLHDPKNRLTGFDAAINAITLVSSQAVINLPIKI